MHNDLSLSQFGDIPCGSVRFFFRSIAKNIPVFLTCQDNALRLLHFIGYKANLKIDGNHKTDKLICSDGLNSSLPKPYIEIRGPAGMSRQTRLATKMICAIEQHLG